MLVQLAWESGTFWALGPGVQLQITRISQIFSCHLPRNCDLPFSWLQTKIPKIGVIGGYFLIRVCRYKVGGYPVPFGPSVPGLQPQIRGISQIFYVTCHAICDLPFFCLQTKILKIGVIGGYFFDSCVQVQGTRWVAPSERIPIDTNYPGFRCAHRCAPPWAVL